MGVAANRLHRVGVRRLTDFGVGIRQLTDCLVCGPLSIVLHEKTRKKSSFVLLGSFCVYN